MGQATLSSGVATLTSTALMTGSREITAVYGGSSTHATSTSVLLAQTVTDKTTTVTTISSSLNPALAGAPITLTATVTGNAPTGRVTFKRGTTTLGSATLVNGRATASGTSSDYGTATLTAEYSGDAANNPSTSAGLVQRIVSRYPTTTALTTSQSPILVNQPVTLSATITSNGTPSGTVTFKNGTTTLGTGTVTNGRATLSHAFTTAGTHTLTAVYGGDTSNSTSTSAAVTQSVVTQYATTTTLTSSKTQIVPGESATLTARVSSPSTPTGTVTFKDGTTTLGTRTLVSGVATLTGSISPTLGVHNVTAVYNGDTSNATSTSPAVVVTVVSAVSPTAAPAGSTTSGPRTTAIVQPAVAVKGAQ